jgi:MFS transporter, OFA family, oxalate/formate antiporter
VLLSSMWPIGLIGHYLIGVIDQKIGTKKTTIVVICILGLGGLLVRLGGENSAVCAVATGMFMFGLSGAANVCMSLTASIYGRMDFEVAYTPIQVIFNVLNFAGVSVMSTIGAAFGQQNIMAAVFAICLVALVPAIALPYKQIASNMDELKAE